MLFIVQVRDAVFVARPGQLGALLEQDHSHISVSLDDAFGDMAPDHDDEFVILAHNRHTRVGCFGCHCRFDSVEDALDSVHLVLCQCTQDDVDEFVSKLG